jgi:hypothetical protein
MAYVLQSPHNALRTLIAGENVLMEEELPSRRLKVLQCYMIVALTGKQR